MSSIGQRESFSPEGLSGASVVTAEAVVAWTPIRVFISEKYGTGTLMMIQESVEHALPEPEFIEQPGEFGTTLWRDWITDRAIAALGLTDRQRAVLPHLKLHRRITNAEYRGITGVTERTASRDLEDLVNKGVLERTARTGRGAGYRVATKPDINPTNPT